MVIRVLIAQDSAETREYLDRLIQNAPGLTVVGVARDGPDAVQLAEGLKPDVILMDAHMPSSNGYAATREIMARTPTRIVMVAAGIDRVEVDYMFAALEAGALTVVEKPQGADDVARERGLIEKIKLLAELPVVGRRVKPRTPRSLEDRAGTRVGAIRLVAIGASTGGPPAVAEVLRQIPKRVPVLVVQHIAAGFVAGFAAWLRTETGFTTKLAERDECVCADTVYVAPDGPHLGVSREQRICLTAEPEREGFRPSISHLFESVARTYGCTSAGVLLSGMGSDGAIGLQALRVAGGVTFAQDEASCAVFGMPREAIRLRAADYVLSPTEIGRALRSLLTIKD